MHLLAFSVGLMYNKDMQLADTVVAVTVRILVQE